MEEAVCSRCQSVLNVSGVEPFSWGQCTCCGAEFMIPLSMGATHLEREVSKSRAFKVYEGYDSESQLDVVVHVLNEDLPDYDKWIGVVKKQAELIQCVDNLAVSMPLWHEQAKSAYYVSHAAHDGVDLTTYDPADVGMLEANDVVTLFHRLAEIMANIHRLNLCHYGLVPDNVHIDALGSLILKNLLPSRVENLVVRELGYVPAPNDFFVAPERVCGMDESKKSDVFQFGAMFYYFLTGVFPFVGDDALDMVYRRINLLLMSKINGFDAKRSKVPPGTKYRSPASPVSIRPEVKERLSGLILACLRPVPDQRPPFSEIISELLLHRADQERDQLAARQRGSVRLSTDDGAVTKTRSIPLMKNLAAESMSETSIKRRKKML